MSLEKSVWDGAGVAEIGAVCVVIGAVCVDVGAVCVVDGVGCIGVGVVCFSTVAPVAEKWSTTSALSTFL